jgi:hypothetical protein
MHSRRAFLGLTGAASLGVAALGGETQPALAGSVTNPFFNVKDYGAVGDGVADDTAAIAAATAAAAPATGTLGGSVVLPAGKYRVTSTISVPLGVTIQGVGWNGPGSLGGTLVSGSWIMVDAGNTFSPIHFASTPGARTDGNGAAIRNVAFGVPNQSTTGAPAVGEPMILIESDNGLVEDVLLFNPYAGVFVNGTGRATIRGVYGQPLFYGIKIDGSLDTNRIQGVDFWPYWQVSNTSPARVWQLANGTGIVLFRCDNPHLSDITIFGYSTAFKYTLSSSGTAHRVHMSNIDCDECGTGLEIAGLDASVPQFVQIANFTYHGSPNNTTGHGILISSAATGAKVQATNVRLTNAGKSGVRIDAAQVKFAAENLSIEEWNRSAGTNPGFYISTTNGSYAWVGVAFWSAYSGSPVPDLYSPTTRFYLAQHQ